MSLYRKYILPIKTDKRLKGKFFNKKFSEAKQLIQFKLHKT